MSLITSGRSFAVLCAAGAVLAAAPAAAALYKWTDASGRVVYSDQPPPGETKVETLKAPPPAANPNATKEMANKDLEFKQRQVERIDAEKLAATERQSAKQKADSCALVQGQLKQLGEENVVLVKVKENGERAEMNAAERRAERDRLAKWFKDNKCPG